MQVTIHIDFSWMLPFLRYAMVPFIKANMEVQRFRIRTSLPGSPYKHEYEGRLAMLKRKLP